MNVAPTITVTTTTDPGGAVASGVDHYDVYRDGSKVNVSAIPAGGPYAWNDVAGQSTSPASGSHSYAYTVVAIDAATNQSAPSPARTILMDTVAPATPAAPTGATPVNAGPTITVTTTTDPGGVVASGVDHYDVYRDGTKVNASAIPAGGPYVWSDVAGQSTNPASGSHSYSYTVFAIDAAGNQSASSPARVILMDSAAPTTPAAPAGATPVNVAPTITVATTTDPGGGLASGVDHYDVYRDGSKVNVSAIPAGGPYVWSDVAGSVDESRLGLAQLLVHRDRRRCGGQSIGAVACACDPDGHRSADDADRSDRCDAGECRADHRRDGDHGSWRSRGLGRRSLRRLPGRREGQRLGDPRSGAARMERRRGPVHEPGVGFAQLFLHRGRNRRGRECVRAVGRARDPDG